jgi:hypothetical protein
MVLKPPVHGLSELKQYNIIFTLSVLRNFTRFFLIPTHILLYYSTTTFEHTVISLLVNVMTHHFVLLITPVCLVCFSDLFQ